MTDGFTARERIVIPCIEKRVFGTMRTRVGESRDSDPCVCSISHARRSKGPVGPLPPREATFAHASSAIAKSVRSAAVRSHASPVLTLASGALPWRVTVLQHRRTSGAGSQPRGPAPSVQASAAARTWSFQSGSGGHRLPAGGATTKR
jgi:hypothetical protein